MHIYRYTATQIYIYAWIKWKQKKYYTVGKVLTSNRKIVERIEPFTHIGMTAHFSGMVERSQIEPFTHTGMTAHFSGMVDALQ
jgi:hypothetical protein